MVKQASTTKKVAGSQKSPDKYYLITAQQQDGEHEHYLYYVAKGKSESAVDKLATEKIFLHDPVDSDMDAEDSLCGFGDRLTATRHYGTSEITREEAAFLTRHHIAYGINCEPHLDKYLETGMSVQDAIVASHPKA